MNPISPTQLETHQLEGQDDHGRVFNRHLDLHRTENGYVSTLYYEGQFFLTDPQRTIKEALGQLVQHLHRSGFSKLRSRLNFRGKRYLAERESWVDYGDATQSS